MATKVNSKFTIKRNLLAANSKSSRRIKSKIVDLILNDYERGISPVKGFNKYKKYRPSTAKLKKRVRPVTLKDSGKLHRSLKAIQKTRRTILLLFNGSRNDKIARYHNFGTPNMDARPMLPAARGQVFKARITNAVFKIVQNEFTKVQ
jgi:hypothetical protein